MMGSEIDARVKAINDLKDGRPDQYTAAILTTQSADFLVLKRAYGQQVMDGCLRVCCQRLTVSSSPSLSLLQRSVVGALLLAAHTGKMRRRKMLERNSVSSASCLSGEQDAPSLLASSAGAAMANRGGM
jgi:hypothetical protein